MLSVVVSLFFPEGSERRHHSWRGMEKKKRIGMCSGIEHYYCTYRHRYKENVRTRNMCVKLVPNEDDRVGIYEKYKRVFNGSKSQQSPRCSHLSMINSDCVFSLVKRRNLKYRITFFWFFDPSFLHLHYRRHTNHTTQNQTKSRVVVIGWQRQTFRHPKTKAKAKQK